MPEVGFEFPRDESQQWDGFNEPGIEHFAGSPFRALGREGTQNTLDAKKSAPVKIKVRRLDIETRSIPDLPGLQRAIDLCLAGATDEGAKAEAFFQQAKMLLSAPSVSVLQFVDSNTTGVHGPCVNGTPYFALMKATGQSKKRSDTSRGSFGIGKFAPFTVSGLRTVFLTTVFQDSNGTLRHYAQGKSILMSHCDGEVTRRGTGFWGSRESCQPLVDRVEELPSWLRRPSATIGDTGTTLSVLGFHPTKDWERILLASIAESFFAAIRNGDLEVEIDGMPAMTSTTLSAIFADDAVIAAIGEQKDEPETFINSGYFLSALTDKESNIEVTQNPVFGHCRLHISVKEGLPKRVAVLRDGMLITSKLSKLQRFSEFKDFAAVLICLSDEGNALLRAMEPPAHDDFEPDRLSTIELQRKARQGLAKLTAWVREVLKRHAQDPVSEVTDLDELAEFFGDDSAGAGGSRDGEVNPVGELKVRARPLPKRKASVYSLDSETSSNDGDNGSSAGLNGDGAGQGEGTGGSNGNNRNETEGGDTSAGGGASGGFAVGAAMPLRNVRAIVLASHTRRVSFTPEMTGQVRLEVEDSGADANRLLRITNTSTGTNADGRIVMSCLAGERQSVDVQFDHAFEGTIRLRATMLQDVSDAV